jgi:drug/metabolite transporter (DMT)-like permease
MKYSWWAWMVVAYCFSITGDIMLKKGWPWIGALIYASSTPFWFEVLRYKDLSYIAIVSSVVGNIMLLAAAAIFLGESLSARQWAGFAVGLIALALMDN